jgi:hypothetical protein
MKAFVLLISLGLLSACASKPSPGTHNWGGCVHTMVPGPGGYSLQTNCK